MASGPRKTVLVTGATGFLGARLARALVASGYGVRATGLPRDPATLLEGLPCDLQPADLMDEQACRALTRDVWAVCHVAAWVTFRPAHYERQVRINVETTRRLGAAARAAGVTRFVYTSTVNALGRPAPGTLGDEETPYDWAPYRLGYMDSKRAAESLVLASNEGGMETLSVLPVTLFGPGDLNQSAGTYVVQAARGRLLIAPPGGTTVAHVDDVAEGHRLALERGRRGGRYILGGEPVSYRRLFGWINEEVGRPGPFGTIPAPLLMAAGRATDRLRRRTGLAVGFSEGLAAGACAPLYYRASRAERELGYRSRPAREAVRDEVAWYRTRGVI